MSRQTQAKPQAKFRAPLETDPLWYKDAVIYQTHVRSFYDSNGDGIGDFPGLTEKLDYLSQLGVSAIWLLPFYPSPRRDDGYDIADYLGIHPEYGTIRDFRNFLREAHARGMRVITELVINHTSDQHPWFQAARRAKPGSPKRDFYVWSDTDQKYTETRIIFCDTETSNWAWDPVAGAYYWHRFYSHQPDLNLNNPKVVQAVIKVLKYWLDMGVDGLRLDAVPYLCVREGTNNENLPETHQVLKQMRAFVDQNYPDRMLLAEANQWPEDVRPYFGDGDECHMAFHFPLMPRIFIALRRENSLPIVDIMQRTPAIPDNCQWGIFLRNHDELTLEMVTDDERDFMYREYATDPRMRLNLGIRRRLAPLVENSTRRLEMLTSLLFSFPGSPIVYYGDEIGMGDNIYLGDRHGVRTPMQWSYDRNGGFSRADPARLFLPPIMDPVYGYQAINVESQDRNPSSPLNFTRRLLSMRRQYKAFGRGSIDFLRPTNAKILAYLREYQDEVILCVCNLSRFTQPVEIDLSRFNGWIPMELLGRTEFPTITEAPYFLTLGPHAFIWFKLEPQPQSLSVALAKTPEGIEPPTVLVENSEVELFEGLQLRPEVEEVLSDYIFRQRWFQRRTASLVSVRVQESTKVGAHSTFLLVDVNYEGGLSDRYLLPVRVAFGAAAEELLENIPHRVISLLRTGAEGGVLVDALFERRSCERLLSIMRNEREFAEKGLTIRGRSTGVLDSASKDKALSEQMRAIATEQSNTSVVFADSVILKVFRNIRNGVNPELEVTRFISEHSTFRNIPRLAGWIEASFSDGNPATLAVLQEFIPNEGDGWSYAVEQVRDWYATLDFEQLQQVDQETRSYHPERSPDSASPESLRRLLGAYAEDAARLGRRTAELHAALIGTSKTPAFAPVALSGDYLQGVATGIVRRITESVALLNGSRDSAAESAGLIERLLESGGALSDRVQTLAESIRTSLKAEKLYAIRCHGDFHLGQVMKAGEDYYILDFEGEPLLPLTERVRKHSPLKDVAGMLRSFSYVAYAGRSALEESAQEVADADLRARATALWIKAASAEFLAAYRNTASGEPVLHSSATTFSDLLHLFLLDKEFYELEYELAYRPTWTHIPLKGILDHLERSSE